MASAVRSGSCAGIVAAGSAGSTGASSMPRSSALKNRRIWLTDLKGFARSEARAPARATCMTLSSAPSASSAQLFYSLTKDGLITASNMGSTDDADGIDDIFSTSAHPDHSRPCAASTRERAPMPSVRRMSAPPQSTGERPRISKPCSLLRLALEIVS